jgi:hyperosmotically inducible protein
MFRSLGPAAGRTLIAACLVLAALPASAQFNPFSAIKGAVEAAVEDRSASDIAKDTSIKAKITANVIDKMGSDVLSLNADVYEQDVMLTGTVKTAEQKATAEKLTRGIEGVRTIHNDIRVAKPVEEKKGAVEGFIDDATIETKINALLIDARGVNVTNFRWRSVEGHVFLFGRALSKEELDKAVAVVKGIKGVASVTSRIKIKPKT